MMAPYLVYPAEAGGQGPFYESHFTVHPDDMDRPSERIRRSRSDAIR